MKKCIISALLGAVLTLLMLVLIANAQQAKVTEEYEHIDYVSNITPEECSVCGDNGGTVASAYWGEDNVGIVNLNTFDLLRLEINRYNEHGELVEEPAGVMLSGGIVDEEAETYVHAYTFPDNAYASVQLSGVRYEIDRDAIQNHLCQTCLDSINSLWFTDQAPAEYAIVSFEDRTIQPLLNVHPWFAAGNFGVDCEFKGETEIHLLIHYCPYRFDK